MFQEKTLPMFFTTRKKIKMMWLADEIRQDLFGKGSLFGGKRLPCLKLTANSALKIGKSPKRKGSYSNHPFSGANWLASFAGRIFHGCESIGWFSTFTYLKFNMEPENNGFQMDFPFPVTYFQVPCYISRVVMVGPNHQKSIQNCLALGCYQVVSWPP